MLISFYYLYDQAMQHWSAVQHVDVAGVRKDKLVLSLATYVGSTLVAAAIWVLCLRLVNDQTAVTTGMRISLISSVAKYVPGNLAHLVGKAVMAAQAGIGKRKISFAILYELGNMFAASLFISLLLISLEARAAEMLIPFIERMVGVSLSTSFVQTAALGTVVIGLVLAALFLRYIPNQNLSARIAERYWQAGVTFGVQTLNFVVFGTSFYLVAAAMEIPDISWLRLVAVSTIAWVAGFAAIGAPGGIGVREAVLLILLGPEWGAGNILVAGILHRLLTVLGDFIAVLFGFSLKAAGKD